MDHVDILFENKYTHNKIHQYSMNFYFLHNVYSATLKTH